MSIEHVRSSRGMPFLKCGMRVKYTHEGKMGRISGSRGDNLTITLDEHKHSGIFHPKWMMKYFDKDGSVIAEYAD